MSPTPPGGQKFSAHKRSRARRLASQALYQWTLTGQEMAEISTQFNEERDLRNADLEYFEMLLREIPINVEALDLALESALDRRVDELDPVERSILRIGVYELAHRPEIPYKVVINEAINLTKKFGAEQSHTYVNGVLDRVASTLRSQECVEARGTRK